MSTDLVERVRDYIARENLIAPGERVLVAVSGGVDSMVLLHVLHVLGYPLYVAHFDHDTRAGASAEDAAFVAAAAKELGLPCDIGHWADWAEDDPANSFEMEARARRHAYLRSVAKLENIRVIATGHHLNDQAETVLLRALRGTGTTGLGGIRPLREEDGIRLVRPLLAIARDDLLDYGWARMLRWREDVSNLDTSVPRNWVRHELLPRIVEQLNPRAVEALARLAESLRVDSDYLDQQTHAREREVFQEDGFSRADLRGLHPALQRRTLLPLLRRVGCEPTHESLTRLQEFILTAERGAQYALGANLRVRTDGSHIHFEPAAPIQIPSAVSLAVPGETLFLEQNFRASHAPLLRVPLAKYCNRRRQVFDADKLGVSLTLRTRRDGDAFVPLGMTQKKKLQDYFVDRHVPREARDRVALLEAHGEIAWVVGHAPGAAFAVMPETKNLALVEVL